MRSDTANTSAETDDNVLRRATALANAWNALHARSDPNEAYAYVTGHRGLYPPELVDCREQVCVAGTSFSLIAYAGQERDTLTAALPVAVMPIRSPVDGSVWGLAWRSVEGRSRKFISGTRKHALCDTPLLYGTKAHRFAHARWVFVVEGFADTLAMETLTGLADPRVCVVGAIDAHHMAGMGGFVFRHISSHNGPVAPEVVVVPHLDAPDHTGVGVGQLAAEHFLHGFGAPARMLDWRGLSRDLVAGGASPTSTVDDLCDAVALARRLGWTRERTLKTLVDHCVPVETPRTRPAGFAA